MHIAVTEGRRVLDPETMRPIGPEGLTVDETNSHWVRLLKDGDVVPFNEQPAPAAPTPVADEATTESTAEAEAAAAPKSKR